MPATRQIASSGIPGVMNNMGNQNLDLWSILFCVFSRASFPINFTTNFSPNLSPIIKSMEVEIKTATMLATKAERLPKRAMPKIARVVFKRGTKQKTTRTVAKIAVYTIMPQFPLLEINERMVEMFAIPKALKIKYRLAETNAKHKTTKMILKIFIIHGMKKNWRVLKTPYRFLRCSKYAS